MRIRIIPELIIAGLVIVLWAIIEMLKEANERLIEIALATDELVYKARDDSDDKEEISG